jgi:ribose/xylose/arabinose/galactoside ABC-type transport system permease subunit
MPTTAQQEVTTVTVVEMAPLDDLPSDDDAERPGAARTVLDIALRYTILWLLAIFCLVAAATNQYFATLSNVQSVLTQASFTGITAAGMTLVIISGAFDLSVGSILALASIVVTVAVTHSGIGVGLVAALAVGAALGVVNGLVVSRLHVPPLVATLGTMYVYLSFAFIAGGTNVRTAASPDFLAISARRMAAIPLPFWVFLVVLALAALVLHRTNYGRVLRAVGTNESAAYMAGIAVSWVRTLSFVLVGLLTGLAAFLQTSQLASASPTVGTDYELTVIAIVVLGGTSLAGGKGTMFGTGCAAVFFAVLNNVLNLYGVASYWQYVATGAVLIAALALEAIRTRSLDALRFGMRARRVDPTAG